MTSNRRQTIAWTNTDLFTIGLTVTHFSEIWKKVFFRENTFENIVRKMSAVLFRPQYISMWFSDTIWRHRSRSILAQVIACCLTAPRQYLDQCWLTINKVFWHSFQCDVYWILKIPTPGCVSNLHIYITTTSPGERHVDIETQWVHSLHPLIISSGKYHRFDLGWKRKINEWLSLQNYQIKTMPGISLALEQLETMEITSPGWFSNIAKWRAM